ncbi:NAD(P)/FAD-dependent oxidoreductase [Aquimarina sp. I32.4]|uniref:phytoene desaturase family protein n=1 Tax=Aquimarina sp. I32.4 TaxID=2053903 RepID=UPI000CDEABF1|nr:NAD(P)/FAD-dependent oxidoreductase [Aquimarina sp. I32.4]
MKDQYNVVIIGSGLGGLISANILAREGYSVCLLEKNNQYGGNLQTFVRDKTIFDTGVHYIGGLSKGQNLYRYFTYLDIIDDLNLKKLDEDGFDIITFGEDATEYKHAQGYQNFIKTLLDQFPDEEKAIRTYCKKLKETCDQFPLYHLKNGKSYIENIDLFELGAKEYIDSITTNKKLKAVLSGSNLLYAGDAKITPFYVHALSVNSYIESAYRCVNGGGQISKALIKKLKKFGGEAYKYKEVVKFNFEDKKITSAITKDGTEIKGDIFISNVDPKQTLKLIGEQKLRKSYVNRIQKIKSVISVFSVYIVLKPKSFKYINKNHYHFKNEDSVWNSQNYTQESWPETYMISMGVNKNMDEWGESITIMTYMHYDEVAPWENTFNTVAQKNDRGQTYEEFKAQKAEALIKEIEKKFPNIRNCIHDVYTSTPLSYRDYIGNNRGSAYGYIKDVNNPLKSFVHPRTKINNLLFTGQSLNMHGILGVTISAVITCSELLGREYLLNKIVEATIKKKDSL